MQAEILNIIIILSVSFIAIIFLTFGNQIFSCLLHNMLIIPISVRIELKIIAIVLADVCKNSSHEILEATGFIITHTLANRSQAYQKSPDKEKLQYLQSLTHSMENKLCADCLNNFIIFALHCLSCPLRDLKPQCQECSIQCWRSINFSKHSSYFERMKQKKESNHKNIRKQNWDIEDSNNQLQRITSSKQEIKKLIAINQIRQVMEPLSKYTAKPYGNQRNYNQHSQTVNIFHGKHKRRKNRRRIKHLIWLCIRHPLLTIIWLFNKQFQHWRLSKDKYRMPLSQFGIRQRQQLMKKKLIDPNKFQQKPKIEFGDDGAAQMLLEQAQLMDIQEYLINMNNNPGQNNQIDNYSNDYEQQDSDSESNNKDIETDTDDLEYDIASDDLTSSNSEEQEFLDFYR